MKLEAVVTIPGDVDWIRGDGAKPEPGKLCLVGDSLSGAEVYADGHRIGRALAIARQDRENLYIDDPAPVGTVIHNTVLDMVLEVPLP